MPEDQTISHRTQWWKVTFRCEDPEEKGYIVFERGAQGVEIEDPDKLHCFKQGSREDIEHFIDELKDLNLHMLQIVPVANENWVQRCQEIWPPIEVGELKIIPCISAEETKTRAPEEMCIYVIPGEGFGTGHHPSTRLAMKLLQHLKKNGFETNSMLDLGTGNAILALSAVKLFDCNALAIDNDPTALGNAQEIIDINLAEQKITLRCGSIEMANGKYNLITANIYAEVLCRLEDDFRNIITQKGYIVLAGIMESLASDVRASFSSRRWTEIMCLSEDGWSAFIFQAN